MNVVTTVGPIEMDIQAALISFGSGLDAAYALEKTSRDQAWPLEQQQSLCEFFLSCNSPETALKFLLKQQNLRNGILWKYFAHSLELLQGRLDPAHRVHFDPLTRACYFAAQENGSQLQSFVTLLKDNELLFDAKLQLAQAWEQHQTRLRERLLQEKETYQSQGLEEQLENVLQVWTHSFPEDDIPKQFARRLKEQRALATLDKKITRWKRSTPVNEKSALPEILKAEIHAFLAETPSSVNDLALFAVFANEPSFAVLLLKTFEAPEKLTQSSSSFWLYLDCLNQAGEFLELLTVIERFEPQNSDEVASKVYYHALALQGLGRKKEAFELMESLIKNFSDHPRAVSTLQKWKDEQP